MSQKSVEVVRELYTGVGAGDFGGAAPLIDPTIELRRYGGQPGVWRGLDEFTAGVRDYIAAFRDLRIEGEKFVDLGGDRVFGVHAPSGEGPRQRPPVPAGTRGCGDRPRRPDREVAVLLGSSRGPRSRGAAGVAVSQENVEIVRQAHDAFARGDVQMSLACFHPESELSTPPSQPGASTYHGLDGVRQATSIWVGTWDEFHTDVEELTDLGEHVLARVRERGRGKGSGVEVEVELFQLFTLRGDRIVRLRMYDTRPEALEAVGVRE